MPLEQNLDPQTPKRFSLFQTGQLLLPYLYQYMLQTKLEHFNQTLFLNKLFHDHDLPTLALFQKLQAIIFNTNHLIKIIACYLQTWSFDRLGMVEQALLLWGCYELLISSQPQRSLIINETIKLEKTFGAFEDGYKMINAVLNKIEPPQHAEIIAVMTLNLNQIK